MKKDSVLFHLLSWFILHGTVLGVDPFEGGEWRMQCIKHAHTRMRGCKKSFMKAYMETESAQGNEYINDPDTYVFLFTRRNRDCAEFLHKCPGRLPTNTNFQADKKTVIIVHGFTDDACQVMWMREMKDQFLYRDDCNVILIDWAWGNKLDYGVAARNTAVVGKQIAFLINGIMNQKGTSPDKFHIVGHSLGAQIAGFAGTNMKGDGKIGRITGLDPAGPGFQNSSTDQRLDPSDAILVDVIHTNAGKCLSFGCEDPMGHADFYPNGGSVQLSCITETIASFLKGDLMHGIQGLSLSACSHIQSIHYFMASINPCDCQFIGVEFDDYESCKNIKSCDGDRCAVMGLDWMNYVVKTDGRPHKYYLDTTLTCPYCSDTGLKIGNISSLCKEKHCFQA